MEKKQELDRRRVLAAGAGLVVGMPGLVLGAPKAGEIDPEEGVTAPEDLMKEHGVLNRCLRIYEEGVRRLDSGEQVPPDVFGHTALLVRKFVEEYHEKNEEKYIFPHFVEAGKLLGLVDTLKTQHEA